MLGSTRETLIKTGHSSDQASIVVKNSPNGPYTQARDGETMSSSLLKHSWKHYNSGGFQGPCMPDKKTKQSVFSPCVFTGYCGWVPGTCLALAMPRRVTRGLASNRDERRM